MSRTLVATVVLALIATFVALTVSAVDAQESIYFVLALQKCNSSGPHTIHGLWPQYSKYKWPSDCPGPAFSTSAIESIFDNMSKYWLSCPQDPTDDTQFWTHEWTKHGTCSGWDELTYFSNGIKVYLQGDWRKECPSYESSCKVQVYPQANGGFKVIKA
jgi:hypothetical protein